MELKPIPGGYKRTVAGVIPTDWSIRPMGAVASVTSGQVDPRIAPYSLMPLVAPDHIESGTGRLARNIPSAGEQRAISGKYLFRSGTVIYSKIRPHLRKVCLVPFDGVCSADMYPLLPAEDVHPGFLFASLLSERFSRYAESVSIRSGMPKINREELADFEFVLPSTRQEQAQVALTLVDADALIDSLEQLLTKKRQIKQGVMQELLTGKRRLPGFTDEWKTASLGQVAKVKTGSMNNQDKVEDGEYPFFVRSQSVERIDTFTHDCEAILVPGEGGIGSIFHYIKGRFALHQRVYGVTDFSDEVLGRFLFFYMRVFFGAHAMENSVKATVDSLRLPTFLNFELRLPPTKNEQAAIVGVLSDLENEAEALESRLTKTRALKQAMAQALLTGRIRLVEPTA
jgi:type I restriction enzyme S subunit